MTLVSELDGGTSTATGRVWEYGPGGKIPPQFMVGAMSLTQSALAGVFQAELSDAREALEAATAWNKILLVQLNVLLLGYMLPPSSGGH